MPGDVRVAQIQAPLNTSLGQQTFVHPTETWQAKAAIFYVTFGVTSGAPANFDNFTVGAATGVSNQWAFYNWAIWNNPSTRVNRNSFSTACLYGGTTVENVPGFIASFVDFDLSGGNTAVTVNFTTAPAEPYICHVLLFGGDDLQAYADFVRLPSNSTLQVTAPGFPVNTLFGHTHCGAIDAGVEPNNIPSLGWAIDVDGTPEYAALVRNYRHALSSVSINYQISNDHFIGQMNATIGFGWKTTVSGNPSGFAITTDDSSAAIDDLGYLALNVDDRQTAVGVLDTPTSPGTTTITPGFNSQLVQYWTGRAPQINTRYTGNANRIFGAVHVTPPNLAGSVAVFDNNSAGTTEAQSITTNNGFEFWDLDGATGPDPLFEGTAVDMDTLNFTAVDSTIRKWVWFALEEPEAGPEPTGYETHTVI